MMVCNDVSLKAEEYNVIGRLILILSIQSNPHFHSTLFTLPLFSDSFAAISICNSPLINAAVAVYNHYICSIRIVRDC